MEPTRGQWQSRLGFILAASGSAIGLGNIVFFGANAYRFGAGAFYLPYLIALFLVGIPVLVAEFGLGGLTQRGFPASLGRIAGRGGELAGWWALINTAFVTMYYVTTQDKAAPPVVATIEERPVWIIQDTPFAGNCTNQINSLTCVGVSAYQPNLEDAKAQARDVALEAAVEALSINFESEEFDTRIRSQYSGPRDALYFAFEDSRADRGSAAPAARRCSTAPRGRASGWR